MRCAVQEIIDLPVISLRHTLSVAHQSENGFKTRGGGAEVTHFRETMTNTSNSPNCLLAFNNQPLSNAQTTTYLIAQLLEGRAADSLSPDSPKPTLQCPCSCS